MINASIYDNSDAIALNDTVNFTYKSLSAMRLVVTNLTYSNKFVGDLNVIPW